MLISEKNVSIVLGIILIRKTRVRPPGGYSLIWAIRGRAAGQGMDFFGLAVFNRVYNLHASVLNRVRTCPKQGMVL